MISLPLTQRRAERRQRETELIAGLLLLGYSAISVDRWLRSNRINVHQSHIRSAFSGRSRLVKSIERVRGELEAANRRAEKDRARAETSAAIAARLRTQLEELEGES